MKRTSNIKSLFVYVVGAMLIPGITACGDDQEDEGGDNDNTHNQKALDCPGMDGTYYVATIAKGECADQGVTLDDRGATFSDQGILMLPYANCTEEVTYDGCHVELEGTCALGMTVSISQTFSPGDPNMVTGTQIQGGEGFTTCEYEIFGSTDKARVLEHAGLPADIDLSDISAPSTPNPENLPDVRDECEDNVAAERDVCPNDNEVSWEIDNCVSDWQVYDAAGCGDGWRAYINCRTEHAADRDCDTGEISECEVYLNAYFKCKSSFASSTGCSVAGNPETLCAEGLGAYSYGCLGGEAPFEDCVEAESASAAAMFCCF